MNLEIASAARRFKVEISGTRGRRQFRVDGKPVVLDWVRLSGNRYSLLLDGRVFDLAVSTDGEGCTVSDQNGMRTLRITDPRRIVFSAAPDAGPPGVQRIRAEMPGKVVRVAAKVGDIVAANEALLVLEAMKMQNEIRAPKAGAIREVCVEPGRTVSTGDLLISLE